MANLALTFGTSARKTFVEASATAPIAPVRRRSGTPRRRHETLTEPFELVVNGRTVAIDVPADMPVLWVLRDLLGLNGTKFGCGIAQCGACTIHLDSRAVRSCVLAISSVKGRAITTVEAIG